MSIAAVKRGDEHQADNYREFIMESESDVSDLPTAAPGSVAYLQDLSKTYLLGPDDTWREV